METARLQAGARFDDRTARHWYEFDRAHFEFDRREPLLAAVRDIAREDVADAPWQHMPAGAVRAQDPGRQSVHPAR